MLVLPAVVSEDNCIYVFLTIGGRMPSENRPCAPSAVNSGGLHIRGTFQGFRPIVGGRDFCLLNTIVQRFVLHTDFVKMLFLFFPSFALSLWGF